MNRGKRVLRAGLLVSGIGIAAAASDGSALAAVQPPSVASSPATVIRGSNATAAQPSSGSDPAPVVLRGTPLAAPQPFSGYLCPPGYLYEPSYGCVVPGYSYEPDDYGYEPDDYGYWPYYGFDGFYSGGRRHRFRAGFAHRGIRFGHRGAGGFGRGFAHFGGFGHGFAHVGGFGRR
jgi:hypothetical protein